MKIAIVVDWLTTYAGAERVLEQLLRVFSGATLFSVCDFLPEHERDFLLGHVPATTFIQKLPYAKSRYRTYLPLMPLAIEQLDLSEFDIVISSSHAVAKGVITGPDQLHISYVHSPIRYAWDLQHQYLRESNLESGAKAIIVKWLLHRLRQWDLRTANGVDLFIANSHFISRRIWKVYRREAEIIYPPVDVDGFSIEEKKDEYYLTASRMVPYKRIDLIVESFRLMPDKQLIVIGDGPEMKKIQSKAGANITLLGRQPFEVLRDYMQRARAFVFAAEEDFGITPVEAQSCGTPVIAYGKGGALETIHGLESGHPPTGVLFPEQTIASIIDAVGVFDTFRDRFVADACRASALRFSPNVFREKIETLVISAYEDFIENIRGGSREAHPSSWK